MAQKEPNAFRIVVLGESAALGLPIQEASFSRILEEMLQRQFPQLNFEFLNASTPGINSHVLLAMAREYGAYSPDACIVYAGNNEFTGPFGAATSKTGPLPLPVIRATISARKTALASCLRGLFSGFAPQASPMPSGLHGVSPDGACRDRTHRIFRQNLHDISAAALGSGAALVLCTVPTNERDFPPASSRHRTGLSAPSQQEWERHVHEARSWEAKNEPAQALSAYAKAAEIDSLHADLHYRMACCVLAMGDRARASVEFEKARDLDALPVRADTHINAAIRETAATFTSRGAMLADCLADFREHSVDGIPGNAFFYDHVHLTFEGNHRIASTLLPLVARVIQSKRGLEPVAASPIPPDSREWEEMLGFTPWHDRYAKQLAPALIKSALALFAAQARPATAPLPMAREELQRDIAIVQRYLQRRPFDEAQRAKLAIMERDFDPEKYNPAQSLHRPDVFVFDAETMR
ncbi:MAG TPA: hypothetical protein PLO62_01025 [Candidatus Hydrogenedentes bacterium]|nr:hypothetical protein [Candidatus Hydrogenedentota bacterium]